MRSITLKYKKAERHQIMKDAVALDLKNGIRNTCKSPLFLNTRNTDNSDSLDATFNRHKMHKVNLP